MTRTCGLNNRNTNDQHRAQKQAWVKEEISTQYQPKPHTHTHKSQSHTLTKNRWVTDMVTVAEWHFHFQGGIDDRFFSIASTDYKQSGRPVTDICSKRRILLYGLHIIYACVVKQHSLVVSYLAASDYSLFSSLWLGMCNQIVWVGCCWGPPKGCNCSTFKLYFISSWKNTQTDKGGIAQYRSQ